jgi:hypothetical protein
MIQKNSYFSTVKRCFKCGVWKTRGDFYRHPQMADGHLGKCIECAKKDANDHRYGEARERVLAYDNARAKLPHRKALSTQIRREYYRKNPDRWKAAMAMQWARRHGLLVAPDNCPACGDTGKMHAHHNDYSRPMEIEWLCEHCHRELRHRTSEHA